MFAADFRKMAREALRGKWMRTALILLLATLLGATAGVTLIETGGGGFEYDMSLMRFGITLEKFRDIMGIVMAVTMALNVISVFAGSLVRVGMFQLGDRLIDGEKPRASMLFPKGIYAKAILLKLLTMLFVSLWSMLFVIPGIIATYRYAMAEYLLYKYPQLTPLQAISLSKQRMMGQKMRLFCLELSFIGWSLLAVLPSSIGLAAVHALVQFGGMSPLQAFIPLCIGGFVSLIGTVLLNAYMHIAACAFFRNLDHPWHVHQAEQRFGWGSATVESDAKDAEEAPQQTAPSRPVDTEPLARELFHRYGCSRRRLEEAGELETYSSYRVDSSVEHRWLREYGQALMLRFSHDSAVLDDLLPLIAEYGMDELLDRVIERIERHIRQNSLSGEEIMNMAGRCLAVAVSGAFDERGSYVQRKRAQIADMARRLAVQLEESDPEGSWRSAYAMICQMTESEN